jgi:hypothetical protein
MQWKVGILNHTFNDNTPGKQSYIYHIYLDRYHLVPYPSCSLRLFSLQIDLLDDFLQDLKFSLTSEQQDIDPLSKKFCSILNSIVYIANVIQQWKTRSVRSSNFFF